MNTDKKLSVAVVGMGFGAEFVPIYLEHPNVEQVAICDLSEERLQRVGERFGIERRIRDVREIIDSDEFDAVHLVSGIPDHAWQTVAMLQSGKHCACTVPMATSLEDLRAIVHAQQASGKVYMMMETAVYTREFLYFKKLCDEGKIGRLQFVRGSHQQNMSLPGWPSYWYGLPPMWYPTHAIAPLSEILRQYAATAVHCFGSGVMREELHRQYGNPTPSKQPSSTPKPPNSRSKSRSLFHCAAPTWRASSSTAKTPVTNGKWKTSRPCSSR